MSYVCGITLMQSVNMYLWTTNSTGGANYTSMACEVLGKLSILLHPKEHWACITLEIFVIFKLSQNCNTCMLIILLCKPGQCIEHPGISETTAAAAPFLCNSMHAPLNAQLLHAQLLQTLSAHVYCRRTCCTVATQVARNRLTT